MNDKVKVFKVGARVVWDSQAAGSSKRKWGKVVALVPARKTPYVVMVKEMGRGSRSATENFQYNKPRTHDSYLVKNLVDGRIHFPVVKFLRKMTGADSADLKLELESKKKR